MPAKKKYYRNLWLIESIMEEPSYLEKPMFGCLAVYLHGRMMLLLSEGDEPWNGLLIPTDHRFHESIKAEFKDVVQHPVLKKWLYLPENIEDFELVAENIVHAVHKDDERFGVEPKEKKPRLKKKKPARVK
jgi:TfoX/Sxy family transcriptional regulator of competence genes